MRNFRNDCGSTVVARTLIAPTADESSLRWYAGLQRLSMPPLMASTAFRTVAVDTNVRSTLPARQCLTLVVHHRDNRLVRLGTESTSRSTLLAPGFSK
jgi:hypothetical protein